MVWVPALNIVLAVIGEIIAGIGIGLAHTTSGTLAFSFSKEGESGRVSGSLQFADSFTPGVAVGIGGAIIAMSQTAGMSMESGVTVAMVFNLLLVLLSLFASGRTRYAQSANHSS